MMMTEVYLSLGSNLGDRHAYLTSAQHTLSRLPDSQLMRTAPLYRTTPVGPIPQDDYFNTACCLATYLTPYELLQALQHIEHQHGRVRTVRYGPRTLDIDIMLYGTHILTDEALTIPHAQLSQRLFMLQPLQDIISPALEAHFPIQTWYQALTTTEEMVKVDAGYVVSADTAYP